MEYDKKIKAAQEVGALGTSPAGESINFYTGSLSFSATDIANKANGMGISLSRSYAVELERQIATAKGTTANPEIFLTRQRLFGDWDMDVPHISTTMTYDGGWAIDSKAPTSRCSVIGQQLAASTQPATGAPPGISVASAMGFMPADYWHGYTLNVGGSQPMLLASLPNNERPSAGGPYHWTTNKDWWISCLPQLAGPLVNNVPPAGEGFLAVGPDGSKYWLNHLSKRRVNTVSKQAEVDPEGYGWRKIFRIFRAEYLMLPTRIEDRFGNWTTYTWTNDAYSRLTSVSSGQVGSTTPERTITLQYNANGFIQSATDGRLNAQGGTAYWTYEYAGSSLTKVNLPDGSFWQYGLADLSNLMAPVPTCEWATGTVEWVNYCYGNEVDTSVPAPTSNGNVYVIHPAGVRTDFGIAVHFQHSFYGGSYPFGISSKTISGPGLTPATWKYSHFYETDYVCSNTTAPCVTRILTDELSPDGSLRRRIFGLVPDQDEGVLLGDLTGSTSSNASGGSPAITTSARWGTALPGLASPTNNVVPTFFHESDYRYVPVNLAPYVVRVGVNPVYEPMSPNAQIYGSERRLPMASTTQTLQGVTFKSEVPVACSSKHCFDLHAKPTRREMSSAGGAAGNFSRTEIYTYQTDAAKWVVGLPTSTTCTGNTDCTPDKVVSATQYHATSLLPWKTFSFGLQTATLTYHADGSLASAMDGRGNTTSLSNWQLGVPKTITFPTAAPGNVINAGLTPMGWIDWTRDELGSKTCYGYDVMGRMSQITYTSETQADTCNTSAWQAMVRGLVREPTATEYGLPPGHWRQTVQTGNAKTTTFYDGLWQPVLTLTEDTANSLSKSFVVNRFDALGRQTFKSYPVATLTSINDTLKGVRTSYDGLGRAIQVQQDSENVGGQMVLNTNTAYLSGFRTQVTNPRGKVTTTAYQAYDAPSTDTPVSILHPASVVTTIARQPSLGKPLSVTRAGPYGPTLSATRSYVYDANERLCKTINPESNSALIDYDLAGNVSWSADGMLLPSLSCDRGSVPVGDRTTRTYDTMNRVTAVDTPGGAADIDTTYHADGAVNTLTAANPGGFNVQTTYTYNRRRLLTGETSGNGATLFTLGYGYNANGHQSTLTYPDGQIVGYAPDALGRTTQVAVGGGQTYASGVTYYPTGAISGFSYGNLIAHAMTPNFRQLPGRSFDSYNGTTFLDDSYLYDANGNVDAITDALPESATSHTRDMGYDDLDRLIVADSPNAVWGHATYSYDPLDNLRTVTIATLGGTVTRSHFYNYSADNRLNSITGPTGSGAYGFTYDDRGNTTWKNVGTANCAAQPVLQCMGKVPQTYVFDRANRLSQVTGVQTYRYDGLGRRVQTTDADGKTTFWMYSQSGQVLYSSEARRSQNISYLYLGNTQVATRTVAWSTGATTVRYQHTDALGSPVVETDAARNVLKRNVFSPWGEAWGTTVVDGTGYTGHVMDQGTGLTYMQQRYYDPQVGRFSSVDPLVSDPENGGKFNSYVYSSNSPFSRVDPDGRADLSLFHEADGLSSSADSFNLPGYFVIAAHANAKGVQDQRDAGPKGPMLSPKELVDIARAKGLKKGQPIVIAACNIGLAGYVQQVAELNASRVYGATGFVSFPTTKDPDKSDALPPYKPGGFVELTVHEDRGKKGEVRGFALFLPGRSGTVGSEVRRATHDPVTGKSSFTYSALDPLTGSLVHRRETKCTEPSKCGK
ncbi:MAG: hypothetical protein A3E01_12375 [Gammaproteobacteria bacterium RIFCSPHIGHO2_12_FULL_63_22]|nr:MAG: hypothetical protein A3E01_12375 [Gammaproteobacteria bacterium RIFCSPHIGHO2_12_FULL_63_22]